MTKKPFYFFWRPLNFEVTKNDLRPVPDHLLKLYFEVIEAYWMSDCNMLYDDLRDGLGTRGKDLDKLFSKVKSLTVVNGKINHDHTRHEFVRALRKSGNASKAAKLRWGGDE